MTKVNSVKKPENYKLIFVYLDLNFLQVIYRNKKLKVLFWKMLFNCFFLTVSINRETKCILSKIENLNRLPQ